MAELFGDRQCPVFSTPDAAHAFLDRVRAVAPAPQAPPCETPLPASRR